MQTIEVKMFYIPAAIAICLIEENYFAIILSKNNLFVNNYIQYLLLNLF